MVTREALSAPSIEGRPVIASALVDIIERARLMNRSKAQFLRRAVTLEAVAAVLLAVAVGIVLFEG